MYIYLPNFIFIIRVKIKKIQTSVIYYNLDIRTIYFLIPSLI
jgi:hypothetical protein